MASLPGSESKTSDASQFVQTVIPQVATAMARAIAYEHIQSIAKKQRDALLHQEKIAAIGVLAYGIRHEINNPLAIIRMKADQLLRGDGSSKPLTEDVAKGARVIVNHSDRIAAIIRG